MEYEIAQLEMRGDDIWELLQDPTLPPLDRDELMQELEIITERLMEIGEEDTSTLATCESQSIGPDDEYDREVIVIEAHFDLGNEI
jgi:hypothetical protein